MQESLDAIMSIEGLLTDDNGLDATLGIYLLGVTLDQLNVTDSEDQFIKVTCATVISC